MRPSDIPTKIQVKNIDPSKLHMNIAGLVGIPADGKVHEKKLSDFRPELREKVWDAIQSMYDRGLIELTIVNEPEPVKDRKAIPSIPYDTTPRPPLSIPTPPGDDFSKAGINDILQQRLYARGVNTYEKFLETQDDELLKVEGLDKANLPTFQEKIGALFVPVA